MKNFYIILIIVLIIACKNEKTQDYREYLNLEGEWYFALDTLNVGEEQKWYLNSLVDIVSLPGTTDLNKKGFKNRDTTTMHLNRVYKYEGVAWYRKEVFIPDNFSDKKLQLYFERTKSSKIWIDSTLVGQSQLLQSPQMFDVTSFLTPGLHSITVQVNNDLKLTPFGNVHIYSDDTQTNWNGILGKMFIEASAKTYISNIQVYPNIKDKKIAVELEIDNQLNFENIDIELQIEKTENGITTFLEPQKSSAKFQDQIKLEYELGDACSLWDEYKQPLYKLKVIISNGNSVDAKTVSFGMREFAIKGTQFNINGRTTFLRGKHEAAVFPLTGFPPMNVEEWQKVYKIAKSYGINHYRFHSYCPPEAAFTAADLEGIYLQAELPFWGGLESDSVAEMQRKEGYGMLKTYVNHPSFVMFSHGNEIWSGHDNVEKNIKILKNFDDRLLYTMGCNNNIGFVAPRECSDFFVGARIPYEKDTILTHTRLTHAFADSNGGGILNTEKPATNMNFNYAVSNMNIPIVSHEIGQYQIYPDYSEIDKYTGVLRARNLEVFRRRLAASGMEDMDSIFQKASGVWSAICYKAEMEAALRTDGFAGFQLLDLQDFPGQGTALVGILDAFMDSKNVVTPTTWKQSCNDVTILLEFSKYCWSTTEIYTANIKVANYSNKVVVGDLIWEIKNEKNELVEKGVFSNSKISNGGLVTIGELHIDLKSINENEKLELNIYLPNTEYSNTYPIWVYKTVDEVKIPNEILIVETLDKESINQLKKGKKVLLFPQSEDVSNVSYPGHFPPEFWNYGMFKGISENMKKPVSPGTLGILTNPDHPIFNSFPTDFHTNWQWFTIIKESNSMILDSTSKNYKPIVQIIDNLERNHKLGLIFEFKVGEGKLLVCMSQLNKILNTPEASQLYQSIINYMISDNFDPDYNIENKEVTSLFKG